MLPKYKDLIYFFLWVSVLVISSCSLKYTSPRTGEEFLQEISRLEKLSVENPDPSVRAKSHLQLARLYTYYKNPHRDYLRGREEFAAYLTLVPAGRKDDEIQSWVSVLEELKKSEKETAGLKGQMGSLTGEMNRQLKKNQELQSRLESLENTNRSLSEANRSLKETIEMLKKLDQQMEEKRRSIR
jgi:exonuclease VII small subunit